LSFILEFCENANIGKWSPFEVFLKISNVLTGWELFLSKRIFIWNVKRLLKVLTTSLIIYSNLILFPICSFIFE